MGTVKIDGFINLFGFGKLYTKERDSLSLFFEYDRESSDINIYKVFYKNAEFLELFYGENAIEKLDMYETKYIVSLETLINSLKFLLDRQYVFIQKPELVYNLERLLNRYVEAFEELSANEIDAFVNDLNDCFYPYRLSLTERSLVDDEIHNVIEDIINTIPFNPNHMDDFFDECLPVMERIPDEESNKYEFRVFNVGQANCSALIKYTDDNKEKYRVVAVFDLGCQKRYRSNRKLEEMISKIDSNTTIIISHFHSDHYNNIINHCNIDTNRWVFPKCDPSRHKAYKMFQALLLKAKNKTNSGTVYTFKAPYSFSSNLTIHQHLGIPRDSYQNGDIVNAESLVCELRLANKSILIPGDALYEEYDSINPVLPFDYILVPHHCCCYSSPEATPPGSKIFSIIGKNTVGIVNCGENKYGHANLSHLSWFGGNSYLFLGSTIYDDKKRPFAVSKEKGVDYYPINF